MTDFNFSQCQNLKYSNKKKIVFSLFFWGTSRLAFDQYLLVLHYQVYGEEWFPKLFSYETLFVRFAKCETGSLYEKKKY